jgi:5'-3' exonuclease
MIVNPQLFNYRLIIGTLVIAIVVLGSYSFSNYNSLKSHQEFLEQETSLVQNELNEMIKSYDEIKIDNNTIELEFNNAKAELQAALVELVDSKPNVTLISKYKNQIATLKRERAKLFAQVEFIQKKNGLLHEEITTISEKFDSQKNYLLTLEEENETLSQTINKMVSLSATNVSAIALKNINSRTETKTSRLEKLDNIEVCLTLLSNQFTPVGNKNIYVQILGPDNQLVSERGHINFKNKSLSYSGMTVVNNNYSNIDVCTKINVESKKSMKEGTYNVIVYQDNLPIGNTKLELN